MMIVRTPVSGSVQDSLIFASLGVAVRSFGAGGALELAEWTKESDIRDSIRMMMTIGLLLLIKNMAEYARNSGNIASMETDAILAALDQALENGT